MNRSFLLVVLFLSGCDACRHDPPPPIPFRCKSDAQCASVSGWHCDLDILACHGRCNLNEVERTDGDRTYCVDRTGPGAPCDGDASCPVNYVCRDVADASKELPAYRACIARTEVRAFGCDDATAAPCGDPSASIVLDSTCIDLRDPQAPDAPASMCAARCFESTDGVNTSDPHLCRVDEFPDVTGTGSTARCACKPRDPFGDACPLERDNQTCDGYPNLPWNGDQRECHRIAEGNLRCVDLDFCRPETIDTCANGVDEDCNGVPEEQEPECVVTVCPDADHDNYCTTAGCTNVYVGAIPPGYSIQDPRVRDSCGTESAACDSDPDRVPPLLPARTPNDACYVCAPGVCSLSGEGENCGCMEGLVCLDTFRCGLAPQ